jgi:hypothetical protein
VGHGFGGQRSHLAVAVPQAAADQGQGIAVTPGAAHRQRLHTLLTSGLKLLLQLGEQLEPAAQIGGSGQNKRREGGGVVPRLWFLVVSRQHQFHAAAVERRHR